MKSNANQTLLEIKEMLQIIINRQQQILCEVQRIREEQKNLEEIVRLNGFILNSITFKKEIIN